MKTKQIRDDIKAMNAEQLQAKLLELRQELFNLRFQHAASQLEKTASIPAAKRNIARVLTALKAVKKSEERI